ALLAGGTAKANWSETFGADAFDLATWQFHCYPDVTKTFTGAITDGPEDNDYLVLDETTSSDSHGSQFGVAFGSEEAFADVRVGATVNVTGDLRSYHGLAARVNHFIDPDGSLTGVAPGIIASSYLMLIHWQDGPANLRIEVFKTVNNLADIMKTYHEEPVPGLDHARSHYAELDVVGTDPVYITGSLYEFKGGPLLARTPTLIDTNANDAWENQGMHDAVYTSGLSAVFSMNQNPVPAGYRASFDDISSVSDGPAAVNLSPSDGATDVPADVAFSWLEASFATSREVWLGAADAMEKVDPAPAGSTYAPSGLELGRTYQWRVDQVGSSGTVTGHLWSFTTAPYRDVDGFEAHTADAEVQAAWPHNIGGGYEYVFLLTDSEGNKSMQLDAQNQYEPYFTEVTRTLESPQDWTALGVDTMSLSFMGRDDNAEHPFYVTIEDAAGQSLKVEHPFTYAVQSEIWRQWDIALEEFRAAGVDLSSIAKMTIGLGSGEPSAQPLDDDRDSIFIRQISLRRAE
ncbi:MAG: hypothetical protein ACYTFQ_26100, partial [Planctomycetota bacterium]